jgi:hypothetical protein
MPKFIIENDHTKTNKTLIDSITIDVFDDIIYLTQKDGSLMGSRNISLSIVGLTKIQAKSLIDILTKALN